MIRVVGIGSPFGDDRLGWEVAQQVAREVRDLPVTVEVRDRPGAGLLSSMQSGESLLLIDAVRGGGQPGTLYRLGLQELLQAASRAASTHEFGVAAAVQLARRLGQLPASIVLFGIEPLRLDGEQLSQAVSEAVPVLSCMVRQAIREQCDVM